MLLVAPVREDHRELPSAEQEELFGLEKLRIPRSDIPAVTHVDYSARIQTVSADDNPKYHRLISRFKEKTGYGIVINTSFNVRGEPIVCSPEDAYRCFMNTEMDTLALGNHLLRKEDQPALKNGPENSDPKPKDDRVRDRGKLRKFGLVMACAFAAVSALLYLRGSTLFAVPAGLSTIFLFSSFLIPRILGPVEKYWMKLAAVMGSVMSRILLMLAYFIALVPTGLLLRLFGRRPLNLDFDAGKKTYWIDVDPDGPCSRPDKQY